MFFLLFILLFLLLILFIPIPLKFYVKYSDNFYEIKLYNINIISSNGGIIKKIIHTGWANSLIRYYDIENSPEYSEEEKDSIKKQAEMVEKSKIPITL